LRDRWRNWPRVETPEYGDRYARIARADVESAASGNRAARPLADLQQPVDRHVSAHARAAGLMNLGHVVGGFAVLAMTLVYGLACTAVDAGACTFHGSRETGPPSGATLPECSAVSGR